LGSTARNPASKRVTNLGSSTKRDRASCLKASFSRRERGARSEVCAESDAEDRSKLPSSIWVVPSTSTATSHTRNRAPRPSPRLCDAGSFHDRMAPSLCELGPSRLPHSPGCLPSQVPLHRLNPTRTRPSARSLNPQLPAAPARQGTATSVTCSTSLTGRSGMPGSGAQFQSVFDDLTSRAAIMSPAPSVEVGGPWCVDAGG
jgi:hypothetical protein